VIPSAAADVAFQFLAHRRLIKVVAVTMNDIDRCHDHAGRAIAALQAMIVAKCRLHRVQFFAPGDALNGRHVTAVGLSDQCRAAFDGATIDVNYTCAALACVASDMSAGETEMITQQMNEERSVFKFG
jgi:hypothetical protein